MDMQKLSTAGKVAGLAGAGVVLLSTKYLVAHTLNVLILLAVIAGIMAILGAAKGKKTTSRAQEQPQSVEDYVTGWQAPRFTLPKAQHYTHDAQQAYERMMQEERNRNSN